MVIYTKILNVGFYFHFQQNKFATFKKQPFTSVQNISLSLRVTYLKNNIRFYHECEGRIEKPVSRIAVGLYEACRVMINGDTEGRLFLLNNGLFFLLVTVIYLFILE